MRRFVIVGQNAMTSGDFVLDDVPGTSGRMDVLVRCIRAAMLVSHGIRSDTVVYLVLLGAPNPPRTIRIDGSLARFIRPDERNLAALVQKVLSRDSAREASEGYVEHRRGISIARGGIDMVLDEVVGARAFVLDAGGKDVRDVEKLSEQDIDAVFFVGDHLGWDDPTRAALLGAGVAAISVGPIVLHAEDAVTLVCNELDRREARAPAAPTT